MYQLCIWDFSVFHYFFLKVINMSKQLSWDYNLSDQNWAFYIQATNGEIIIV